MSSAEKKMLAARRIVRRTKPTVKSEDNPMSVVASDKTKGTHAPSIVRTTETERQGVHSFETSRYTLGYIFSGKKNIYMGDHRWEAQAGDVFFLSRGTHFVEDIPARGKRGFEQVMFFYTPDEISRALANLAVNYDINTCVEHSCEECMRRDHVISTGWATLEKFFEGTVEQLKAGFYEDNPTSELLAFTMLVYHIVSQPECCLRTRVLGSTDPEKELMERIIHEYIYSNISLDELAMKNNRSLSSFKKKFREHFGESPHRWVVRRRLMHARMQVIQTGKTTTEIARECHFGNTSHFINLFRTEYGLTPFQYRRKYKADMAASDAFLDDAEFLEDIISIEGK